MTGHSTTDRAADVERIAKTLRREFEALNLGGFWLDVCPQIAESIIQGMNEPPVSIPEPSAEWMAGFRVGVSEGWRRRIEAEEGRRSG